MKSIYDIVIAPVITEASMDKIAAKTYTFKVAKDATKPEIASAVEKAVTDGPEAALEYYTQAVTDLVGAEFVNDGGYLK